MTVEWILLIVLLIILGLNVNITLTNGNKVERAIDAALSRYDDKLRKRQERALGGIKVSDFATPGEAVNAWLESVNKPLDTSNEQN